MGKYYVEFSSLRSMSEIYRRFYYIKYQHSPNFLVLKFCGNAQLFPQSFGRIARKSVAIMRLNKVSTPRNEVKFRYFMQGYMNINGGNHLRKQTKFTEISSFQQKLLNRKIQKIS